MKTRHGFTLIELMITMTIMVILVSVSIISLRGSQANARDAKRASDVETIARGLEQRYDNGMPEPSGGAQVSVMSGGSCSLRPSDEPGLQSGTYPSTEEVQYVSGASDNNLCPNQVPNYVTEDLAGTSGANYAPPSGGSFSMATANGVPTTNTVGNNYYYQPLASDGSLCTSIGSPCVNFNLYYVSEVDGALHTTRSLHQ